ncbi:hypothetical protein MSG28_013557 [Choristoneura fumiferana]|uniref:Uncharacterized protein n=1 Tax=Choristoneura fumiferana TaxID=7141 RepID=A0ACC0K7T4_CHOFU|nr:hypothetical protein MSG28_013557 [Choristoneura fumiferana]
MAEVPAHAHPYREVTSTRTSDVNRLNAGFPHVGFVLIVRGGAPRMRRVGKIRQYDSIKWR